MKVINVDYMGKQYLSKGCKFKNLGNTVVCSLNLASEPREEKSFTVD